MAYTDPLRLFYIGDRQRAARYVNDARRFAFLLMRELSENGVLSGRRRHRLADETVIDIIIADKQVTAVIDVRPKKKEPPMLPDDFVVWPRNSVWPDGIDGEFPSLILRPPENPDDGWITYFHSQGTQTFDSFGGRKGTYGQLFPDGVTQGGNVDWIGPDNERLSWYGPHLRYWYDHWRGSNYQYARFVFLLGRILLDIDTYCDENDIDFAERMVVGAALCEGDLLVMQANMPLLPAAGSGFPPTARPFDTYTTAPWPTEDVDLRLVRYGVTRDPEDDSPSRWSIAPDSHETLWTTTAPGYVNPWFFDPEGRRAVSVSMPTAPILRCYVPNEPDDQGFITPDKFVYDTYSASHDVLDLTIPEEGAVTFDTTPQALVMGSSETQEAIVAVDYTQEGERVELFFGYDAVRPFLQLAPPNFDPGFWGIDSIEHASYFYRLGAQKLVVREFSAPGAWVLPAYTLNWTALVGVDLRTATFVTERRTFQPDGWTFQAHFDVWYGGVRQHTQQVSNYTYVNGSVPPMQWQHWVYQANANQGLPISISPLMLLHSVCCYGGYSVGTPNGYYDDPGCAARTWYRVRRSERYGILVFYAESGAAAVATLRSDFGAPTTYYNDREDFNDMTSASGMAAAEGIVLYSGVGIRFATNTPPDNPPTLTYTVERYATQSDMVRLTGIDGPQYRYYPIRVLGRIPKQLDT